MRCSGRRRLRGARERCDRHGGGVDGETAVEYCCDDGIPVSTVTFIGFTGPAGTGKTWSLLHALDEELQREAMLADQRVLGLTFMHGSRRRLHERLEASSARGRFECYTFDRFAWEIVRRWRSRRTADPDPAPPDGASHFDLTCSAAARLLRSADVVAWVARRFPVVIVDEFQDCSIERLGIVQALAPSVRMLVAADEFQDLRSTAANDAVTWLKAQSGLKELSIVRRTDRPGLLAAALALRAGRAPTNGDGFEVVPVPVTAVAASKIAFAIMTGRMNDLAVLSPARPAKSPFVAEVVSLVSTKSYGKRGQVGPFTVRWEETVDAVEAEAVEALQLTNTTALIKAPDVLAATQLALAPALARWVEHQRSVCGRTEFAPADVLAQVQRAAQQRRAFGLSRRGWRAMTVHQAKNREFDHVVVLWPYQVTADPEAARRLLYNAITRARHSVLVLVQDPSRDPSRQRIKKPPFE